MQSSLTLQNKLTELDRLGQWVAGLVETLSLSPAEAFPVEMCLEEIVTNVMKYAYGEGVDKPIVINARLEGDALVLEVIDEGDRFNPLDLDRPPEGRSLDEMEIGGLGVHLTRQMMDEVSYARRGAKNILTMKKRLGENDK